MTREEIIDFCDMKAQLEPENEDIFNAIIKALEQEPNSDIRLNSDKNELNRVKDELEPTTKNCESCRYYGLHHEVCNYCYKCSLWTEQEQTTKNNLAVDCISRVEVLKIFDEWFATCNIADKKDSPKIKIKALPSVTPHPRKGHWIDTNILDVKYKAIYMCSNCRSCYTEMKPINMNFCPNCSADMRGEEE